MKSEKVGSLADLRSLASLYEKRGLKVIFSADGRRWKAYDQKTGKLRKIARVNGGAKA